jgi:hypothetical protein
MRAFGAGAAEVIASSLAQYLQQQSSAPVPGNGHDKSTAPSYAPVVASVAHA